MGHSRQIIQQQCEFDMAWYSNYDHIYDNREKWQQQLVWLFSCGFIFSLLKRHKKCQEKYILIALPPGGGGWKFKKRGWKFSAGAGLLKRMERGGGGGWHFSYLTFSSFIVFAFKNYCALCKILCIWKKWFFSVTIILGEKVILSCLKMNLKISHKLR